MHLSWVLTTHTPFQPTKTHGPRGYCNNNSINFDQFVSTKKYPIHLLDLFNIYNLPLRNCNLGFLGFVVKKNQGSAAPSFNSWESWCSNLRGFAGKNLSVNIYAYDDIIMIFHINLRMSNITCAVIYTYYWLVYIHTICVYICIYNC